MIGVVGECDPGFELGWEAGIRTPITCSRGMRPTVGRPPSAGRCASRWAGTSDYSAASGTGRPVERHEQSLWQIVGAHHLFGIRYAANRLLVGSFYRRRLLLLATMTRHPAFAAGFARFLTRPLVRGALLVRRFATL